MGQYKLLKMGFVFLLDPWGAPCLNHGEPCDDLRKHVHIVKGGASSATCVRQAEGQEERADLGQLMRKNAFLEEKTCYRGEVDGKMPTLTTPPASSSVAKLLDSDYTPPPVGIQTVSCQFGLWAGH